MNGFSVTSVIGYGRTHTAIFDDYRSASEHYRMIYESGKPILITDRTTGRVVKSDWLNLLGRFGLRLKGR